MKGQITVFIILGVLVLAAFAIVFYAASIVSTEQRSSQEFLSSQPVEDYVSSCLSEAVRSGVVLLGSQGGRIFVSQGGIHDDPVSQGSDFLPFDDVVLPYSVLPPSSDFGNYFIDPPKYPFVGFPFVEGEEVFSGFFGFNRLPPLYEYNPDGRHVQGSVQESLESYVESYVQSCADWSSFPYYEFETGVPNASLVFASDVPQIEREQSLSVMLSWPIVVSGQASLQLEEFAVKVPVRLAAVYYFISEQLDKDTSDISFEPSGVDSFSVSRDRMGFDNVLSFEDSLSVIRSAPFVFNVARMNRRPALWELPEKDIVVYEGRNSVSVVDDELVVRTDCGSSDRVYRFDLRGSDPDGDALFFGHDPSRFMSAGDAALRVSVSDQALEDYQDLDVEVVPCVPS